ncbi:MAG: transposase, partial [Candidatus Electrothrix sp. AUS3]|nr:transposase [Candidatus Electrothrix gigas]
QTKGIISLDQMADIVNESKNNNIIKLCGKSRFAKYIKDEELRFIDQLLDNEIINRLLAYEGYKGC